MDTQEQRIEKILSGDCEVGKETSSKYLKYLSNSIKFPCLLTGIEDFPWEEPYILGGGNRKEYERFHGLRSLDLSLICRASWSKSSSSA